MGGAAGAGTRPAVFHSEMKRVPVVFDAIYNPGRSDEEQEENAG